MHRKRNRIIKKEETIVRMNDTKHSIFFKMIRLDKILKMFAVLICMLIISSSVFAVEVIGTLLYWESDGNEIGRAHV